MYYLFHDVNSFLRMKLKGNCELFGTDDVHIVRYKHFAMYIKKCLQTAYCVLCCDLMNKPSNISILQGNNHKMLSHLESNFKHRLILVDIRFGNEGISPG